MMIGVGVVMDHEGWRPDWPTLDLHIDPAHDPKSSSAELSRAFRIDFEDSSSPSSHPERPEDSPEPEGEGRLIADFWASDTSDPVTPKPPRPTILRRPSVPGYEILDELGRGAMGVVYRARQLRLNREVALKMILAGDLASSDTQARFLAEAVTIAKLSHPHIVQIFAIGDHEGRPFVELEYVEGGSLGSRLDGTPWPPRSAARLVESLARAAAEAHRLGIVHRDLKPANILMTAEGEPKISDFGLAKTLEEESGLTRTESILGSPNYMAPEQADGRAKDVGPWADIYALGASLYELLTGRPPFLAPTVLSTLDLVKNSDPVPPRKLQPLLDRDLETICLKCLEKKPEKRYETAQALAEDIAAFLADEPIKARRAHLWERAAKWVRKHPSTAALILVCALGTLSLMGVLEWRRAEVARVEAQARRDAASLRSQIGQCVSQAREAMRRGEWETAQTQLIAALALIQSEARLASMTASVDRLFVQCGRKIAESRNRESARQRFADFQRLYDEAVFYQSDYTGLDPEANIRASRASSAQALAKFGLGPAYRKIEGEHVDLTPDPLAFDPREIEGIQAGCYELTLLLAESISHTLPGEDAVGQNGKALDLLESVRRLGGISPAFHLQRAVALERSGDRTGADRERTMAGEVPASSWSALDHFLVGEQAYRRKDLKLAIESFRHSLSIQPDRFWAQYFLAVCLLREHRSAEAQACLIACQSRKPGFVWAYLLKGFAEGEIREFDLAEEDFRRAGELRLNDQERYVLLVNRGVMRIRRGRNEDAVTDLAQAIALKPNQFEAAINLSMALQRLERWDEALAALDRAIQSHPREPVLYRTRGQLHRLRSRTSEALEDLRKVIDLTPPDDSASVADLLEVASILQQAGRSEEALAACDQALRLKPNRPEIHRVRGVALMMLRRFDEAVGSFDVCLARGGDSAALYEARGLALTSRGSYDRAMADYTMALNLGPATPSLLASRGWVYLLGGASAPALRDFNEALRLEPANGHALGGRALAHVQLRKPREAVDDARASVLAASDDSRQVYNAARVFCQAAACLESSVEKNGMSMATAGQYRIEALSLLARAVELCPAADRARFWDEVVRKDASLDPVRRLRSFKDLSARVANAQPPALGGPVRGKP